MATVEADTTRWLFLRWPLPSTTSSRFPAGLITWRGSRVVAAHHGDALVDPFAIGPGMSKVGSRSGYHSSRHARIWLSCARWKDRAASSPEGAGADEVSALRAEVARLRMERDQPGDAPVGEPR